MSQIYVVKQGETLSVIARRFGCTASQLRDQNPFIINPNYIRAGWKLQIPEQSPAFNAALPVAEEQSAEDKVLYLDPIAEDPNHGQINFCGNQVCSGDNHFADIIYEVGHDCFWLLRAQTLDSIVSAADKLRTAVVSNDPDSRLKALDDRGLLAYFLEPKLSSFLDAEKSQRLLEIEHELKTLKSRVDELMAKEPNEVTRGLLITVNLPPQDQRELTQKKAAFRDLNSERRMLEAEALEQAKKEGYRFEGLELFSPEAIEVRAIIKTYLEQREALLQQKTPEFKLEEVDEFRKFHKRLLEDLAADIFVPGPELAEWVRKNTSLFHYSELTQTLARAAAYGLALPEFALHKPDEDIALGIRRYREYHQMLKDKQALEKSIEEHFDIWLRVGKQTPPGSLFTAEREQWKRLQQAEKALREQAEENVRSSKPELHLIWQPEVFKPAPEQRLVRTNFPLREVSVPTERARLSHFSFADLSRALGKQAAKNLKEDLIKAAQKAGQAKVDVKAGDLSDDKALDYWLDSMGARKLVIQDVWFDASGFFSPEQFKRWLKAQRFSIDNLRDEATFDAWGKDLRQMLFRKNPYGPLRLFDNSPQARLIRCLTPPKDSLHSGVTVKGFQFSLNKGASSSAEAFLDVNLARGEVDLLRFELPKRAEAQSVIARYTNHKNQEARIDLGRFCFEGSIKAWGFAGASLLLTQAVALKPSDRKNDLDLDTRRDAEQGIRRIDVHGLPNVRADEVISANLNLFAGVQAGIKISGSLQWAPPKDLISARKILPSEELDPSKKGWLTITSFGANMSVAVGVGGKANFNLSLQNGQIILRLKAALIAGPGAEGEFCFVLGYKAMTQFLDILNRELIRNEYQKLDWIEPEVFEYFTKAQVLHAVGVDLQWVFLLGYDVVNKLYDAMTAGERAGVMAYQIDENSNKKELQEWFALLTPEGLGSLLNTLLSAPEEFEINMAGEKIRRSAIESNVLQQRAIVAILGSIYEKAQSRLFSDYGCDGTMMLVQKQFKKAISRLGSFEKEAAYQVNMRRMDEFVMKVLVTDTYDVRVRDKYRIYRGVLGDDVGVITEFQCFNTILNEF